MANRRRQASARFSLLTRNSSNGMGRFRVHTPPGERKAGIPHSVEIPAPGKGKTTLAACTRVRNFGHLGYEVDDIYATCERLMKAGVTINRPPRDGVMAFVRSPDRHSIELLQKGGAQAPREPWLSMPNTGHW